MKANIELNEKEEIAALDALAGIIRIHNVVEPDSTGEMKSVTYVYQDGELIRTEPDV